MFNNSLKSIRRPHPSDIEQWAIESSKLFCDYVDLLLRELEKHQATIKTLCPDVYGAWTDIRSVDDAAFRAAANSDPRMFPTQWRESYTPALAKLDALIAQIKKKQTTLLMRVPTVYGMWSDAIIAFQQMRLYEQAAERRKLKCTRRRA